MSKELIKFNKEEITVKHDGYELENIKNIILKIDNLLGYERELITNTQNNNAEREETNDPPTTLGDADSLRYYEAKRQINMDVYSAVAVGFKNLKDRLFDGDYSDYTSGIITGRRQAGTAIGIVALDENEYLLKKLIGDPLNDGAGDTLIDSWNKLYSNIDSSLLLTYKRIKNTGGNLKITKAYILEPLKKYKVKNTV